MGESVALGFQPMSVCLMTSKTVAELQLRPLQKDLLVVSSHSIVPPPARLIDRSIRYGVEVWKCEMLIHLHQEQGVEVEAESETGLVFRHSYP